MISIRPLGNDRLGWLQRPWAIDHPLASSGIGAGAMPAGGSASIDSARSASALTISSSVSQLLNSVGGGLENNQMLEMIIALLIMMALLDQNQRNASTDALKGLAQSGSWESSSWSYSSIEISTSQTYISYTSLLIENGGFAQPAQSEPPQIDVLA